MNRTECLLHQSMHGVIDRGNRRELDGMVLYSATSNRLTRRVLGKRAQSERAHAKKRPLSEPSFRTKLSECMRPTGDD